MHTCITDADAECPVEPSPKKTKLADASCPGAHERAHRPRLPGLAGRRNLGPKATGITNTKMRLVQREPNSATCLCMFRGGGEDADSGAGTAMTTTTTTTTTTTPMPSQLS